MKFSRETFVACLGLMQSLEAVSLRTFAKNRRLPNWLKNQKRQFNNYHNRHLGKGMKNRRNFGNFHFAQDLQECALTKNTDGRLQVDCEDHFEALLSDIYDGFFENQSGAVKAIPSNQVKSGHQGPRHENNQAVRQ